MMLSRIWSILLDPDPGTYCPALSAENSCLSSSSSYSSSLYSGLGCLSYWGPPSQASALVSLPPSIVLGCPTWPVNMPAKGRGRTSGYCFAAPAEGSLIMGGLFTASCVTLGGVVRGLYAGSSTGRGFCLLDGEMCTRRLVSVTTCVAPPTINPD